MPEIKYLEIPVLNSLRKFAEWLAESVSDIIENTKDDLAYIDLVLNMLLETLTNLFLLKDRSQLPHIVYDYFVELFIYAEDLRNHFSLHGNENIAGESISFVAQNRVTLFLLYKLSAKHGDSIPNEIEEQFTDEEREQLLIAKQVADQYAKDLHENAKRPEIRRVQLMTTQNPETLRLAAILGTGLIQTL